MTIHMWSRICLRDTNAIIKINNIRESIGNYKLLYEITLLWDVLTIWEFELID